MRQISSMLDGTFTTASSAGQHPTHASGGHNNFVAHVVASAIGGTTPSATVVLEDSADGVNWAVVATQTITANGVYALRSGAGPVGEYVRVRLSAFTGTAPTITLATKGVAK